MIGCNCPVCTSPDPHNSRTRCSVYIEAENTRILIDTPPELRLQALREDINRVDAVLFTHAHADHLFGLDDVRRFNELSGKSMPCYGSAETHESIRRAFEYVFVRTQIGGGKPSLNLIDVDGPFDVDGVCVTPIPVLHGRLNVLGYRIGDFAYVTDCSYISEMSMNMLQNLDTLILGVLRPQPHETHFSLAEGIEVVETLKPNRAFFTHIAHKLDHEATNSILPPHIRLAYDGLKIKV